MDNIIDTNSGSSFVPVQPFEIIVFGGTGTKDDPEFVSIILSIFLL